MNPLLGKKIESVWLAEDKLAIKFNIDGEGPIVAKVDADCCSFTWIENVENPEFLLGTVTVAENLNINKPAEENDCDVTEFYGFKIETEKGTSTIDYRNTSNGYYGGDLCWPDDYHYGGVYGQNKSDLKWEQLA